MNDWLIRTAKNVISGPISEEELKNLIEERKLAPEDEICRANQYWFSLREAEELKQQLGIEYRQLSNAGDETRQIEIEEEEEKTDKVVPVLPQVTTKTIEIQAPASKIEPTHFWHGLIGLIAVLALLAFIAVLKILSNGTMSGH